MTLTSILLPVDFSDRSAAAAVPARWLAERYGAQITVLHVIAPLYPPVGSMETGAVAMTELYEGRKQEAERLSHEFLQNLEGVPSRCVIRSGDPAHHIIEFATTENVGLIIMPTHGYGPFRRFLLGSVTAKVLHDAPCPVLTGAHIETAPEPMERFNTILAAVDLGPDSERVLQWTAQFARDQDARVAAVHATPSLEGHTGEYFDPQWRTHLISQAEAGVRELMSKTGVTGDVYVEAGEVAAVVAHAAEQSAADLVVIGRHGSEGILGRLKAHGYAIVRQAPCAVMSV
jgi:nucleotide-binding universal stress UspA family protein